MACTTTFAISNILYSIDCYQGNLTATYTDNSLERCYIPTIKISHFEIWELISTGGTKFKLHLGF